jgi:uncharacterized membrane protein YfcA
LQHLGAFAIGILIGFLGGLFGKGGSAIATPLLSLIGYPGFIAVVIPSKARDLLFRKTKGNADSSGKPRPSE